MMKRLFLFLFLLWCSFSTAAGEVKIYATADLHGNIAGFLTLAPLLRSDAPAIRIDCGDTIQGTVLSRFTGGATMIDALNVLDFDFWIPGNHDFESGFPMLSALGARFHGKVLGAEWHWGAWNPVPWAVAERNGFRIAVIGLTDPKMPQRTAPGSTLQFQPPAEALRAIMPEIRRAKPDLTVLAWHSGIYSCIGNLYRFLKEFPEIDLVIGAHSHEEHPGERITGAWFVQPGCLAQSAALITARFDDETRKLIRIESRLLRPDPAHPAKDETLAALLAPALTEAQKIADRVLCTTGISLKLPGSREYHAPTGQLGTQALLAFTPADAALFTLPAGNLELPHDVTEGGIYSLLPYENRAAVIRLKRQELKELAEEQLALSRKRKTVPFFAGITVTADKSGRVIRLDAPPELVLVLNDYTLLSSSVLRPLLDEPEREWKIFDELERDLLRRYLFQHPGWTPSRMRWFLQPVQ